MSDQAKMGPSCGGYSRGAPWYPLRKWWHLSQLLSQDAGLEPGDACWMDADWPQRSSAARSWPGSTPHPSQKISKWRVVMDVAHFSPAEISLDVRDGFLEVRGKHEERPDERGSIARCFTRKYRLPVEVDATQITSALSADGFLNVEAPVPEASVPAAVPIPINVVKAEGEPEANDEPEEATDLPECAEDHGEGSSPDVLRDEGRPGAATEGLQQHDGRREGEQTREKSAAEPHPSGPGGDKSTESLQEASHEGPDADTSTQLELRGPEVGEELQVMAGSGEAAEHVAQPEEQVQSLEAAEMKQELTQ